jgi:glycosyltransferase involved in cell wall biosynthesis
MNRAHRVLAVSGALRERLVEIGVAPEKVMVYHNGVDQQRFFPRAVVEARRELGLPVEGRHVVYVGFLQEAKALHVLLQAVALRKRAGRLDYTAHLVGDGPLAEEL